MKVEVINNEIVVRIPMNENLKKTQNALDYLRYLEISSNSSATKEEIDSLLSEIKKDTWDNFKKLRNINA